MIMIFLLILLATIMSKGSNHAEGTERCGGVLTAPRGLIQTPNFPRRFTVPLRCRWVVDGTAHMMTSTTANSSIVIYFTQLFVTAGLTFTEFDYYEPDSTFQLGGREIHRVTEQNATTVQWLLTHRHYLVIDFTLERLEGHHLRVLDGLLDVYGFNITYDTTGEVRNDSCSVVACSLLGHCYTSRDHRRFWCSCFPGYSRPDCGKGPLCRSPGACLHGGTCRQAGASTAVCLCPDGFSGQRCEVATINDGCTEENGCTRQCMEDTSGLPCSCKESIGASTKDRARYEGTVRLTNVSAVRSCLESATCSLKPLLTKQIARYLRVSNLTTMEELKVIDVGFSGEVRFHFWGERKEGSRVREALNRLVQKGRLGNTSLVPTHLAITQEPTLLLKSVGVNQVRRRVRQGEEFILSCSAHGSSHMTFHWFKDDVFINITRARRSIWTRLLPLDATEQYTALLGVERADILDTGRYTCQVSDWGYQQCQSVYLQVLQPPLVRVYPLSLTVEKGDNVTLKCTSDRLQGDEKLGYSWTRNNALFKMTPELEFWEDLYPGGSILRVYNVQRSTIYACHVHGSIKPISKSVHVEVLDKTAVPWCENDPLEGVASSPVGVTSPSEGVASGERGVVRWPRAGPGGVAKLDCPPSYTGTASRLCLLVDRAQASWQSPDFSGCVSENVSKIVDDFRKLTLGYGNVTSQHAISRLQSVLKDHSLFYPGEMEPVVSLLHRIVSYVNQTGEWQDTVNSTQVFYRLVDLVLQRRRNILNHQKVEELLDTVKIWSELQKHHGAYGSVHLSYDCLAVDIIRYESANLSRTITLRDSDRNISHTWTPRRIFIHILPSGKGNNSLTVSVVAYHKLSEFLPQRYSYILRNGEEVVYEVASPAVSLLLSGSTRAYVELEMTSQSRQGWELVCAVTHRPTEQWDMSACKTQHVVTDGNSTLCMCHTLGTYALVWLKRVNQVDSPARLMSPPAVLVGCVCCLVQSLLTLFLLALRFWRHRTCILYLKIQCCSSTATSMTVFVYATSQVVPQGMFSTVSTVLQASVLVSMSSHLSKVLIVYTEVVYLPKVNYIRQTIICIITGVPLLVVLCNHIALSSTDVTPTTWWLVPDTLTFYTCVLCVLFLLTAFIFLFFQVFRTLRDFSAKKCEDARKAISRRIGLLIRAAVLMTSTVLMFITSVIYANALTSRLQYFFSFSSALLGFSLLICYVLHCESPLHLSLLRTFKLDNSFSSDSNSSTLNFAVFTKQDAEKDCKAAPTRTAETVLGPALMNGKAQPPREVPPILKTPKSQERRVPKTVTFKTDPGCEPTTKDPMCMEVYPSSPRKFPESPVPLCVPCKCPDLPCPYPPDPLLTCKCPDLPETSARVCVITSVVVNTPSVVVCSVDVEPCYVLDQSIVHATAQDVTSLPLKEMTSLPLQPPPEGEDKEAKLLEVLFTPGSEVSTPDSNCKEDVMDRICHDLDYLLGGLPQEMKEDIDRNEEKVESSYEPVNL